MYEVEYTRKAEKQLSKLSKFIQSRIFSGLERARIRPSKSFSRLVGKDAYKLRIGDYRILADIYHEKLIILVIQVASRQNVYK